MVEEIQSNENQSSYKLYFIVAGIIITASCVWVYSDEIRTGAVSLLEFILSFWSGGTGGDTTGPSSNVRSNNTMNIPIELEAEIDLIDVQDKGKARAFTSPSLDNLNETAQESWSDYTKSSSSSSPDSTSSTETITPSSFKNISTPDSSTVTESIAGSSSPNVKFIEESLIPISIVNNKKFIRDNINNIEDFQIRRLIVNSLVEIEIEQWELINKIKTIKIL